MNKQTGSKLFRAVLSVFIIPTFVFMCATACHCPNLQASSDELVIKQKASCCCPDGNTCNQKPISINKDQAANVQAFEVEKLVSGFKTISSNSTSKEVFSFDFISSVLRHSEIPLPSISSLATVQLLI